MKIRVGHTPDADDAFMFYGMLNEKIPSPNFEVEQVVDGIEKLNRQAMNSELDVTAVSVHSCAHIHGYTILRSGGSFGLGYGPVVVARDDIDVQSLARRRIAIPGKLTSAFLLLQICIGRFDYTEMEFDKIPQAVSSGEVDAGLVIHEAQITYKNENLTKVLDIGTWWNDITDGLPMPLGINVMKTALGNETIRRFNQYLQDSIKYGLEHRQDAVEYAMKYGRGNPQQLIDKFVRMYVNPVTVDMGDTGEEAIRRMFTMAHEKGLVSEFDLKISPP